MYHHIPVLLAETLDVLNIQADGFYVDCTAGGGGHSGAILSKLSEKGRLIAIDRDALAVQAAAKTLAEVSGKAQYEVVRAPFSELKSIIGQTRLGKVNGLLADLGVSSAQIDNGARGYSYHEDGPLDMRMDQGQALSAVDVVNTYDEEDLARIFREYGEERYAGRIAAAVVAKRRDGMIQTTKCLADIVAAAMPAVSRREKQHPARRVFQAVRIEVNAELDELRRLLNALPEVMADKGRVAIISFHSLEDRLVKQTFREWQDPCHCPTALPCTCGLQSLGTVVTKKGLTADAAENAENRRAASARLRAFEFVKRN